MSLENTNAAVEALLREKHMVALLKERIAVLEGQLASGAGDVIEAVNKTSEIFRSVRDERDALRAQVDRDQKQILELQDQTSEIFRSVRDERDALRAQVDRDQKQILELQDQTSEIFRSVRDERDALRAQVDRDQKQILELQDLLASWADKNGHYVMVRRELWEGLKASTDSDRTVPDLLLVDLNVGLFQTQARAERDIAYTVIKAEQADRDRWIAENKKLWARIHAAQDALAGNGGAK
jgi:chromosome segregation ATPase